MIRKILAAAAVAAAGALALGAAGTAHAGVQPVKYTDKGTGAVSGYYAQTHSQDEVGFTHIHSYLGSDGAGTIAQFTPSAVPIPNAQGDLFTSPIANGGGVGLCDQTDGVAAQVGDVYLTDGNMDVVLGYGQFTAPALNNGDICENGIIPGTGNHVILLADVPVNDTVKVDLLYDGHHAHNGCHAGQVTAFAQDLAQDGPVIGGGPDFCYSIGSGHENLTEADAGVVADTTSTSQLPGTVPLPDGNTNLLIRYAHISLNGNDLVTGHEVFGTFQNNAAWDITPVAATTNGHAPAGGTLLLGPGVFSNDHFSEFVGPGVA